MHLIGTGNITLRSPRLLQASSPDEEALVQGAAQLGFRLRSRSLQSVSLQLRGLLQPLTGGSKTNDIQWLEP